VAEPVEPVDDELEPGQPIEEVMTHELDELAELIERAPELTQLSAEDFDQAAYELQMIEFEGAEDVEG
jgi:hypothetical protein